MTLPLEAFTIAPVRARAPSDARNAASRAVSLTVGRRLSSVRCSAEGGVQVYPVERHTLLAGRHGKLIFGYGHLSPAEIALGVARLAQLGGAELAMAQIGAWQTGSWSCRATRPDTDALKRKRIW